MKNLARYTLLLGFIGLLVASSLFVLSCGGDDDDDDDDDNDSDCEPLDACVGNPALSEELPVTEFEVSGTEDCEAIGIDIEVIEVRLADDYSRMEARISFTISGGGTFYTYTINSEAGTPYDSCEACYLDIAGTGIYDLIQVYPCTYGMEIQMNEDPSIYECTDAEWNPACRFSIAMRPWPPEGDCIEDPS